MLTYRDAAHLPGDLVKKRKSSGYESYVNTYLTLDTETSHTPMLFDSKNKYIEGSSKGWIYQWAVTTETGIHNGRTPSQLIEFYDHIINTYDISEDKKLVTYIHNASYDFEYLCQYFAEAFGSPSIVATGAHSLIQASYPNGLVFRCSYRLSNKSLEQWSNDYDVAHKKLVGFVDYDIIRYQDSKLTYQDYLYMWNDVLSMRECIDVQMKIWNDDIASIPLTSTGYIRRNIKRRFRQYNKQHGGKGITEFKRARMNAKLYHMANRQMAGGLTHGNRHFANKVISVTKTHPYIDHGDFESMYPTEEMFNDQPVGVPILEYEQDIDPGEYPHHKLDDLTESNRSWLAEVIIADLCLKDNSISFPYAQVSKFTYDMSEHAVITSDNGRVLRLRGMSRVCINEIDYKWLRKQYNFKMSIERVVSFRRKALPSYISDEINELYANKTNLKRQINEVKETATREKLLDLQIRLLQTKALLNSIYGMTATNPVRQTYSVTAEGEWYIEPTTIEEELDKYYSSKTQCMRYVYGIWCTSLARDRLLTMIECIQEAGGIPLYCDTDSVFYLSNDKVREAVKNINAEWRSQAIERGAYTVLDNGEKHYYCNFADENEDIKRFKFLHAKCYGTISHSGKLSITVAGVPRRSLQSDGSYIYREDELGRLSNLKKDFVFATCGGTGCKYEKNPMREDLIDGHITEYANAAIIFKTTKKLSELDINMI